MNAHERDYENALTRILSLDALGLRRLLARRRRTDGWTNTLEQRLAWLEHRAQEADHDH